MTGLDGIDLAGLLARLLGRDVTVADPAPGEIVDVHPATYVTVVDDRTRPFGLLGTDLALAHATGAALAMVVPQATSDPEEPDEELLSRYRDAVDALVRRAADARGVWVRAGSAALAGERADAVVATPPAVVAAVAIEPYGTGHLAYWPL
jgi:hypothetical protein